MNYDDVERIGDIVIDVTLKIKVPVVKEALGKVNLDIDEMDEISQEMAGIVQEELDWVMEEYSGVSGLVSDVLCNSTYVPLAQGVQ